MRATRLLAVLLVAVLAAATGAPAQTGFSREAIRDFSVRIAVEHDGSVLVTEDIEVVALGQEIRRGIFRDIPLGGAGVLGIGRAPFELVQSLRDGRPEPNRIERSGSHVRIYLGKEDVFLEPGIHRYRLVYRMGDQVRRFEGFDEIYWNATGNDWSFPIEQARAEVVPPTGAPVTRLAVYTGHRGARGEDAVIGETAEGRPLFRATRTLEPGEGMTVAVGWPPGFVAPEGAAQRLARWLERWGALAAACLTFGLVLAYYLVAWVLIGRDPRPGTVVPVYHPDLPPAAMRYIERMGFDDTCLSAALVSLAVKGHLDIRSAKSTQTLMAAPDRPDASAMSDGEAKLYDALFAGGGEIAVQRGNRARLDAAAKALSDHFDRTFNRIYFHRNRIWFAVGIAVTIAGWLLSTVLSASQVEMLIFALFPTVFAVVLGSVLYRALKSVRAFLDTGDALRLVGGILEGGVAIVMLISIGGFFTAIGTSLGIVPFALLIAVALLNVLFWYLLKAPTALGQTALDEINGTRLYMSVAEADRLRFHNPPDRTPEHFHELLPYAIALDLETAWTNQFQSQIAAALAADHADAYLRPSWYRSADRRGFRDVGQLRAIGARLGGAYAAATVSRSSGGGSSGGGSSGGGGGGGGGGGW